MNETARQISELINATSPSGANTTHSLAELGNGNMQNGLKRIVNYFAKNSASNLKLGRMQGAARGALGAAAIAVIIVLFVRKQKRSNLIKKDWKYKKHFRSPHTKRQYLQKLHPLTQKVKLLLRRNFSFIILFQKCEPWIRTRILSNKSICSNVFFCNECPLKILPTTMMSSKVSVKSFAYGKI